MAGGATQEIVAAAAALVDACDSVQRGRLLCPFDSNDRTLWYYTPNSRPGLALLEMTPGQQQHARALLRSGLSEAGYNAATAIIGLEAILAARDGWPLQAGPGGDVRFPVRRDPQRYYVSIWGEPGSTPWAWTFGGHHLSVHFTFPGKGESAHTPLFLGADPAAAPMPGGQWLRLLAPETDLGLELVHALDVTRRRQAMLTPVPATDIMQSNRRTVEDGALPIPPYVIMGMQDDPAQVQRYLAMRTAFGANAQSDDALRYTVLPKGLAAADMTGAQRAILDALLKVYFDRVAAPLAEASTNRLAARFDFVHFAWAGKLSRGEPHYYRIQAPGLLIEYDNPTGDHIHSVWRDPERDFGMDLLAMHRAEAH